MQRTSLIDANFENADLGWAQLQGADLRRVNFKGANLMYANLNGANVSEAEFDEKTVLPNERKWTPETDLREFGAIINEPDPEALIGVPL